METGGFCAIFYSFPYCCRTLLLAPSGRPCWPRYSLIPLVPGWRPFVDRISPRKKSARDFSRSKPNTPRLRTFCQYFLPPKRPSSSGVRPTRGTREHTLSCPLLIELVELITLKYGSFVFSRPQMCRWQALRRHTAHIPATTGGRSSLLSGNQLSEKNHIQPNQQHTNYITNARTISRSIGSNLCCKIIFT